MGHINYKLAFLIAFAALLLAACSNGEKIPPPPTAASEAESLGQALEQASIGQTPPSQPAATANLAPTATIAPPATTTPLATNTPTPIYLRTAEDFGDNRNPLTGEEVSDPSQLARRPLAIKISNAPPKHVRPQSGLNDADLIFEHITEAGITRFTMIVYGKTPPAVGPIRSARLIDLELPAMYDSALVYSGSSEGVRWKLLGSDFRPRIIFAYEPGYYRSGENKPTEHTFYGKPVTFWEVLEGKGLNERPTFNTYMAFSDAPPPGGEPAGEAIIDYDWTLINWRYDPGTGRYLRWTDGEEHLDGNTGEQVSAANVVVILSNHIEDPNICEQLINGVCTALSVQPQIWGSGPAIIFRDGQRYDGTWERANRYDMFTFHDASGQPIPLQLGNTWFQILPIWYDNPVTTVP
jgi:hypothetical protein